MLKVMTIVGTRPEIIKLSCVIKELDKYTNQILVHTGQNYDYQLNEVFFDDLGIRNPDYFLGVAGDTPIISIANVLTKVDDLLQSEKPDAILLYGDTNSCLAVISAKKKKIPIFHMEAGNRCFDQRVPEEINRKIIDHTSDINMTLTEHARRYLISEGIRPETVFNVGSSMKQVINENLNKIYNTNVLDKLNIKKNNYFVVSIHREENIDSEINFLNLMATLNGIAKEYNMPIIISTHPRTRKKIDSLSNLEKNENLFFCPPFSFSQYLSLQINSFCVVSDSGTITEESSILGFPAITIREAHERPEGMDEGTLIMSGLKVSKVIDSINTITKQVNNGYKARIVKDYDVDNVSVKVVRIILSYTEYINRTVWHKDLGE